MPEYISSIEIPDPGTSGTFPVAVDFGAVFVSEPQVTVHRFGHGETQVEQRFYIGPGVRRISVQCGQLTSADRSSIVNFFALRKGNYQPFTLEIAMPDGTTGSYTVRFAQPSMSLESFQSVLWRGAFEFVEVPPTAPSHAISLTTERFPAAALKSALLSQVQECIPLLKISTDIYLSDRRVTVGGQLYQPRLLDWSGISQSIDGAADQARFSLGNADKVFTSLVNAVDLWKKPVEFAIFHVGTTTKLNLWKGYITKWSADQTGGFSLEASDGLIELNLPYPAKKITRDEVKVLSQPVNVGGKKGISRITASSAVNDTAYGKPIKDVWVNNATTPLPVECELVAGRDESEFYAALGIVGRGPISGFSTDAFRPHTLEGQPHHGPGNLGLRRAYGGVPSTGSETATDNSPDAGSLHFALDSVGGALDSNPINGLAFLQIRRTDEKGIQPIRPTNRQMIAQITGGLGGFTWTGAGPYTRAWTASLTNPVWIAVNTMLRAKGLQGALAAAQEAVFDCGAAIAAATVCNAVVDTIIPEGSTETQFTFTGIVAEEKPLRDWLQEILGTCLGYWSMAFGRLRIGIRNNSSTVEPFTAANHIYNSLQLASPEARFNDLTGSFADVDYGYQQNALNLVDTDHVTRIGERLKSNVNLVGVSTKSQAARLITTRLREELGGLTEAEQIAARQIGFKTTVLALNTEPGMVCSMTHADMPGGAGEFRLIRWTLNRDWSIDLEGRSTTDAMYDLTVGDKPADVLPSEIPYELYPQSPRQRWHPNSLEPDAGDPFYAVGDKTFSMSLIEERSAIVLLGAAPVNVFLTGVKPPILPGATVATTGGTVPGGSGYYLAVCCYDANGHFAPPSNILSVVVPTGTATNKITLESIDWPTGTWTGYMVFFGRTPDTLTGYTDVTGALPTTYAVTAPPMTSTYNLPNPNFHHLRVKAKRLRKPGIAYGAVSAVSELTIVVPDFIGAPDYAGRVVSVITDVDGSAPLWNYTVSVLDDQTGALTVAPDPLLAAGDVVGAGDMLVVRCMAEAPFAAGTITDSLLGLDVDGEAGNLVRIIAGTGKGQVRRILSNTATVLTLDTEWDTTPTATSVFVIELPTWEFEGETTYAESSTLYLSQVLDIPIQNWEQSFLLTIGVLVDRYGTESSEEISPVRDVYVPALGSELMGDVQIAYA